MKFALSAAVLLAAISVRGTDGLPDRTSSLENERVAANRLWKEIVFDTPETRPLHFGGWSRSTEARFVDYAVVMDVFYADGTMAWNRRARFSPGTHDWTFSAAVFNPEKPVARVKVVPVARKGVGEAEFAGLFFDFEVSDGMPLRTELRTDRPYSDKDELLVIVRDEKKSKNRDHYGLKEGFVVKPVSGQERNFLQSPLPSGASTVWTADSMRRVTPLTFPTTNETRSISLELARREHESAQVLVTTASDVEWIGGNLTISSLKDADGCPLRGRVSWERVGYLPREPGFSVHPHGTDLREKWLPDPLLPAAPFRVRKGATQALWVTACASHDAAPGTYTGEIVISEQGEKRAVVPISLTVRDFVLPETFGLKTAFAVMDGFLMARYPGDLKAKRREAWDILLDHRMNPDDITRTTLPDITDLVYARRRGMNHFTVLNVVPETKPGEKWTLVADPKVLFSPSFYESFAARLRPYVAQLKEKGLLDCAALYGFDERQSEYYAGIDAMWKKLRVDFPGLPLMTTAKMYADLAANKTNLPALVTADVYCPCTYRWNEAVTAKLRSAGKSVWWYTCCSPFAPYANFASYESPTIEGRVLLGFMTHKYQADGFLFWHVNNWDEDTQPTLKADDTFFPDWQTYNWVGCPGDGVLLYPGENEIYPSIRLAQIRDGIEDYEWLQLAVEKAGRSAVDAMTTEFIASQTDFTRDPQALRAARSKVASLIDGKRMVSGTASGLTQGADYTPAAWNVKARQQFAAQRFGIFIHWGLYASYAQGEWYQQQIGMDTETYGRAMDGFCPSKFDAKEWVRVFKRAGAKYVTITSRHHDGFSLWPTKADDGYNIANAPFRRDILGELSQACDEAGLQLNFYYSLMDWHRRDYPAGSVARKIFGEQKGDYASYKKFMMAQIAELIDGYHPGCIWFDGEWEHAHHKDDGTWERTLDWELDDIYDLIHSKNTLVANNNHQPIRPKEDVQLFERDLPGDNTDGGFSAHQPVTRDRPLEQCDVIQYNVWGYRINEQKFRTADDVVAMIARAAANDANLLMNIGPDGSGRLPVKAVEVMAEVGRWMDRNGESIYGTRAGGVGLVKDVVSTRNGNVLYLHFLNPSVDKFAFRMDGEISAATYLADGKPAQIERTAAGDAVVTVSRPKGLKSDIVVKIVVKTL